MAKGKETDPGLDRPSTIENKAKAAIRVKVVSNKEIGYHPDDGPFAIIHLSLPLSHLDILEKEAEIWGVSRSEFLGMLSRRKRGLLKFERPDYAPNYSYKEKQLKTLDRYAWYLRPRDRNWVEADRIQMGNVPAATWVVLLLNDWIGRPQGLSPATEPPQK